MSDASQLETEAVESAVVRSSSSAAPDAVDIDAVVARYEAALLRYVRHLIGAGYDEAQDVVQEAFIRFVKATRQGGGDSVRNVKCWLFRTAHNLAMDYGRKRGRRRDLQEQVMTDATVSLSGNDGTRNACEELAHAEICRLAVDELDRLPGEQKTVLMLKMMQNLTLREVSEITGLKIGTVNYRLSQALETLAARLRAAGAMQKQVTK